MISFLSWAKPPLLVAVAGPNGAGKSTFYRTQLRSTALPFINADQLALEFGVDAYRAAEMADRLRRECVSQKTSFIFETVLSDPVGEKVAFLASAEEQGYTVVLCFIGISSAAVSDERVAMRVLKGGHDVPRDKLRSRFPRTLRNLRLAIHRLSHVYIYDNDDLAMPYRKVAVYRQGKLTESHKPFPAWFKRVMKGGKTK